MNLADLLKKNIVIGTRGSFSASSERSQALEYIVNLTDTINSNQH